MRVREKHFLSYDDIKEHETIDSRVKFTLRSRLTKEGSNGHHKFCSTFSKAFAVALITQNSVRDRVMMEMVNNA